MEAPPHAGHEEPHPLERPRRRPSRRGKVRASTIVWSVAVLLALLLVASAAIRSAFTRPTPVSGDQGFVYGQVVNLSPGGRAATVRLDNGKLISAQADAGQEQGAVKALAPHFKPGDRVQVAYYLGPDNQMVYALADYQRGPALVWLLLLFVAIAAAIGRGKALRAVVGTAAGLAIIASVVVPAILRGANPVLAALAGSGGILVLAMYFVHGLNWKTTAALCGTLAAVVISLYLGSTFLHLAHITDFGTEESVYLVTGNAKVNIQGLVLTAVVIGALGALVDITIGQASAVSELAHLGGTRVGLWELYHRGMNVGFDHIGSLINTLVLAYVGSSLPTFVLLENQHAGWRDNLNLELVAVELVQALVGGAALILAVPLTTFVAAAFFRWGHLPDEAAAGHVHHHH